METEKHGWTEADGGKIPSEQLSAQDLLDEVSYTSEELAELNLSKVAKEQK